MSNIKFKVVLVGESNVGKSNIFTRITSNRFDEYCPPTLGAAFKVIEIELEGKVVNVEIWDTAGQERYHSLSKSYSRDASIIILVYDITDLSSFEALKMWHSRLQSTISQSAVFAIFANKQDLENQQQVIEEEVLKYSKEINAFFKRTSAKENEGIREGFYDICKIYLGKAGIVELSESFHLRSYSLMTRKGKKNECCK